jgi:superfamily II DNA or RNA helicase
MDNDFRSRLSFSGTEQAFLQRENWREALRLLPEPILDKYSSSLPADLPTILDEKPQTPYIEWLLTGESHSSNVMLVPYFIDGTTGYRIPSFSHLFNHFTLNSFDFAWATFFAQHFFHDDECVILDSNELINTVLWALARAKRLRLASDKKPLDTADSLQLKARLRYSEEWSLWALDAELVTATTAESMTPESLDFITPSGLVAYQGKLFSLPKGAAWIAQLLVSGSWFVAPASLGEALYHLSQRIQDGDYLRHLSEISCIQKTPLPVVYLRSKQFEQQTQISLYLAFRYGECEVFSLWHSQEEANIPIGFETSADSCTLHFRDFASEATAESLINQEERILYIATKQAWMANVSGLWQLVHGFLQNGWEVWAEKHKIEQLSTFGINLESGIGWFELKPIDTNTRRLIDPLQLIKYLKRKALFIQLGNGTICVLPERWIDHLTQFLDIGAPEADKGWCFSAIYAPEIETILGDETLFQADEVFHTTVERMRSLDHIRPLTQPEGLRALLRPYQLDGLTWLNLLCELHIGGILADDMGLGKTVQILALLQHRFVNQSEGNPQIILVVCPKSVQSHWLAQINNVAPRLSAQILHAKDMLKSLTNNATQHRVLLASYGLIRHHIEMLSTWQVDLLILDEAQMIKNQASLTTQAIKRLRASQRFALTGTPIENRFDELVSIFTFLNPYAQLNLSAVSATPEAVRELVQRALHPFVLRRLKEDVLPDLPPKTVEEVILPMEPDQRCLYQELQEVYRNEIAKNQNAHRLPTEAEATFFLEGLMRLRQVATHPQQLLGVQFQRCASNKMTYLCEHIPILIKRGHRIVVFSQFLGFLKGLSDEMKQREIRHSYVDGVTMDRDREISLFQSNTAIKVLLISLRVGGVGIDLTNTDVCIIADPWWNEAVEKQAIDRLHRFGQKKNVTVLRLISEHSIEEKMELLKKNKSALADAIGKTNPDFLKHLKWDDFTEIF